MPGGGPRPGAGIGTVLFDSVYLAAEDVLKGREGRKALILISDGVDYGSKIREAEAIQAAHRADTIIYSIRYYDSDAYPGGLGRRGPAADQGSRGIAALEALSRETGGRMQEVSKKLTLEAIFGRIQEELRNQYSLGYTPPDAGGNEFRRIRLRTTDSRFEVVTRAGYYPRRP